MLRKALSTLIAVTAATLAAVSISGHNVAQADTAHCSHASGASQPFLGGPSRQSVPGGHQDVGMNFAWACSPSAFAHWRLQYESSGSWFYAACTDDTGTNQPCTADFPFDDQYVGSATGSLFLPGPPPSSNNGYVTIPVTGAGSTCAWNLRFKVTFEFASIPNEVTYSNTTNKTC